MRIWLSVALLHATCLGFPLAEPSVVNSQNKPSEPTLCDPGVQQYSGYIDVAPDKHLFYWFFEARKPRQPKWKTPLIMWLNGGPGCSSLSGLFSGVGPCYVDSNSNGTIINKNSWNKNANILFLDQPTNTGYSYGANINNTADAARDTTIFLNKFYSQFPQYSFGELHIMGESYAAHYVPSIAAQIVSDNNRVGKRKLPLTSIAVGNGLFNMASQYKYLPWMACNSTYQPIVNDTTCIAMIDAREKFLKSLEINQQKQTNKSAADATFAGYDILTPYQLASGNPYDVRKVCDSGSLCDPYMDTVVAYANQPSVYAELGVRTAPTFELCNPDVQNAFISTGDELVDTSTWIPYILAAGVHVLNYAGDADLICNWMGNKALMLDLQWPGRTDFSMALDRPWGAGGLPLGYVRTFSGLTFLRIFESGHMVAKDQPWVAQTMLSEWLDYHILLA
ncbi:alpha/beta-hydrolase [Coemansia reversa NRRL 1564]|uniref:carboxypeptidase C n=1 Tax=Coemansia reversa (strain ATCC 12441 / NRRL 1564) TaxID=763665 RepID=A0A2G5BBF6_COERN|nr:alpha/beta-hydrolase [Coemansia reversa NRRL 1564]|eukprot:PIA16345.1 alpha/beta-hydrolase [Coemansia reversa NRRL 1564]